MQDKLLTRKISLKNKPNYYGLLLNIFLTKDKKLIVVQNTNDFAKVLDLFEIQKNSLDNINTIFKDSCECYIKLEDFINNSNLKDKTILFCLEYTSPSDTPFILNELDKLSILSNNIIVSSERDILLAVKEKNAKIKIMLKADNFTPEDYLFLIINKASYMIKYTSLTKERVDQLHEMNIAVNACNIKEIKDQDIAELLTFWNVDMITEI